MIPSSRADKKEDLEWLKEQPEWESVVAYFRKEVSDVKDAMVRSGVSRDDLVLLNAKGGALSEVLEWAKKRPKKAEAQK